MKSAYTKKQCSYCGESPINHRLCYLENLFSTLLDPQMVHLTYHAPRFLKNFADRVPVFLFEILVKLKLAHFSSDIEKVSSFRSRVIWEEAIARGIRMEQIFIGRRPLDSYRAFVTSSPIYFESIPIRSEFLDFKKDWDNKIVLKNEFTKHAIPVPRYAGISPFELNSIEKIFSRFDTAVIVKPESGSRARHTVTNIQTLEDFKKGIAITRQISPFVIVEEHLNGYICRATLVGGILAGFYRGQAPFIIGDGVKTIEELIVDKNAERNARYSIRIEDELYDHIARSGFTLKSVLREHEILSVSHRRGQLFGGDTKEMIDELHPSFIPILQKAAKVVGLAVAGFDCIIPDPTKDADSQRWGIIECNTLPFIDMHYFALEGKPRNIAGMIWDMWK